MNTNLNDYKERVNNLRKAVSSVLKIECTQSQAYELIAKEEIIPIGMLRLGLAIKMKYNISV